MIEYKNERKTEMCNGYIHSVDRHLLWSMVCHMLLHYIHYVSTEHSVLHSPTLLNFNTHLHSPSSQLHSCVHLLFSISVVHASPILSYSPACSSPSQLPPCRCCPSQFQMYVHTLYAPPPTHCWLCISQRVDRITFVFQHIVCGHGRQGGFQV